MANTPLGLLTQVFIAKLCHHLTNKNPESTASVHRLSALPTGTGDRTVILGARRASVIAVKTIQRDCFSVPLSSSPVFFNINPSGAFAPSRIFGAGDRTVILGARRASVIAVETIQRDCFSVPLSSSPVFFNINPSGAFAPLGFLVRATGLEPARLPTGS